VAHEEFCRWFGADTALDPLRRALETNAASALGEDLTLLVVTTAP
jgi:hypothetical protein